MPEWPNFFISRKQFQKGQMATLFCNVGAIEEQGKRVWGRKLRTHNNLVEIKTLLNFTEISPPFPRRLKETTIVHTRIRVDKFQTEIEQYFFPNHNKF